MVKDFNILIVEDEILLARIIEKMIVDNCKYKTNIEIVESAEKALERISENMPDFIFLNQYMSGMTGLEMVKKCKSLKLRLPSVVVITGGMGTREYNSFLQLGIRTVFHRLLKEGERDYIMTLIEEDYENSVKIPEEDMMRLIQKQTEPILESLEKTRTPYQITLMGVVLKYLIENKLEYTKENRINIFEYFKKHNNLEDKIVNEIQVLIEGIIEENYAQGNPIRKLNYSINKDEIQEEFFHKLKKNVIKDIIAESN